MNNFIANYNIFYNVLQQIEPKNQFIFQIRKPKLSDLELISVNLTAEYMGIDSEYQIIRCLKGTQLEDKITRTVFNRRKKRLTPYIENIRIKIANKFNEFQDYFIIDSMPLEVCKIARSGRSKICREDFYSAPDKGYCASQKFYFYGYKLHAVCSTNGVFQNLDITKASVHDIHYLKDIKHQLKPCVLLGDKGYLSAEQQLDLFNVAQITLETPERKNQLNYKKQPYIFRKTRKRIETLFSQLCDQFMIRRNYAKSFAGFKTRILSKITALTVIQYINHLSNRNINQIKINIA